MRPAASPRWHLPRWVLLVGVALGLAAMHTLGHAGMDHTTSAFMRHEAMSVPGPASATGHTAVADRSALDAIPPAQAAPGGQDGMAGGMWSVCLAVLACTAALLMLAWLYRRSRVHDTRPAGTTRAIRHPRGPPPLRLCLVATSVIRR